MWGEVVVWSRVPAGTGAKKLEPSFSIDAHKRSNAGLPGISMLSDIPIELRFYKFGTARRMKFAVKQSAQNDERSLARADHAIDEGDPQN